LQLHKIEEQDDVDSGQRGGRAAKTEKEGVLISWVEVRLWVCVASRRLWYISPGERIIA
jgi:hypothetical protein